MNKPDPKLKKPPIWVDNLSDEDCRECLDELARYIDRFGPEVDLTNEDRTQIAFGLVDLMNTWVRIGNGDPYAILRGLSDGNP